MAHPLVSRLIGRPAIKNLEIELEAIEKKLAKFRLGGTPAQDYADTVDAAAKAFIDSPTPEKCRAWILAESGRDAAAKVLQSVRDHGLSLRGELLNDLGPQIRTALDELLAGMKEQRGKVVADDEARSLEFGEEVHNVTVLAALDRKISQLEEAKGWVDADPPRAISAFRTVIG